MVVEGADAAELSMGGSHVHQRDLADSSYSQSLETIRSRSKQCSPYQDKSGTYKYATNDCSVRQMQDPPSDGLASVQPHEIDKHIMHPAACPSSDAIDTRQT